MTSKSGWLARHGRLALVSINIVVFCLIFVIGEIGIRVWENDFSIRNRTGDFSFKKNEFPMQLDHQLGWRPRPCFDKYFDDFVKLPDGSTINTWFNKRLTVTCEGFRDNDNLIPETGNLVLALGDSFTFGSQVANSETWPSALERLGAFRVVNAGVPGYGLDQAILYLEQLAPLLKPKVAIVSFIADDLDRAASVVSFNTPKPYFTIKDGELTLNPPLAESTRNLEIETYVKRLLGRSLLADRFFSEVAPEFWDPAKRVYRRVPSGEDANNLGCALMARVKALSGSLGLPIIIMQQYSSYEINDRKHTSPSPTIECARKAGLPTIDLRKSLQDLEPARRESFFVSHMTKSGNAFVAGHVMAFLKELGLGEERPAGETSLRQPPVVAKIQVPPLVASGANGQKGWWFSSPKNFDISSDRLSVNPDEYVYLVMKRPMEAERLSGRIPMFIENGVGTYLFHFVWYQEGKEVGRDAESFVFFGGENVPFEFNHAIPPGADSLTLMINSLTPQPRFFLTETELYWIGTEMFSEGPGPSEVAHADLRISKGSAEK